MTQRDLNSYQRWWIELLADYNTFILYYRSKKNVIAVALIWKAVSMDNLAHLTIKE